MFWWYNMYSGADYSVTPRPIYPADGRKVVDIYSHPEELAPRMVGIDAVAAYLGVTVRHVRRLVNERRIPFYKWSRLLRFDPAEISAWVDNSRVEPGPSAGPTPLRSGFGRGSSRRLA